MSRTTLSLRMLDLLQSNDIISKSELAKRLKTKPRNIIELRKELEQYGYKINIILGKQGGYQLVKNKSVIDDNTKNILSFLHDYIRNTDIFPKKYDCLKTLEIYIQDTNKVTHPTVEIKSISYLNKDKINNIIGELYDAICNSYKTKIKYLTIDGTVSTFEFLPYNFLKKYGVWYCVGKQNINNIIINKELIISNIIEIETIRSHFTRTIDQGQKLQIADPQPIKYYYVDMIIKDRWDLYSYKFGINQTNIKIDEHQFSVNYIEFNYDNIKKLKTFLYDAIVKISIRTNN